MRQLVRHTYTFIALKEDDTAALVSGREVVTRLIEFYRRYDIG